ncbi:MAG: IclR family transcriptional regulator [Deltaproteobacteria bacterium]|nr:IclR family transcriptional regulator [Deltaproteobacteria bacterium]
MKYVESLKRGLEILQSFSVEQPRLRLREIALKNNLPKPTAYRFLRTLLSLDFVRFDPVTNEYQLGPRVLSLGFTALSNLDLREAARPWLEDLFQKTKQTVNLGILEGREVVYISRIKQPKSINLDLSVGSRLNSYRSSIGRAILAHLEPGRYTELLGEISRDPEAAEFIGPGGDKLSRELSEVRRKGYALNDGSFLRDHRVAAAPVFNAAGEVLGAVSIAVLSRQCSRKMLMNEYVPLLLETTRAISSQFGYQPPN